jgi:lipopolysaccharide transport system ATP-binding protein
MAPAAVSVEQLGKLYRIGGRPSAYRTLRDAIAELGKRREPRQQIWALDDVSFEIEAGQAFGIIGANGAGKTTLLKILSRITPPTTGRARVRGRVGALLEVGTGFHPELTGRENIFLNGAILGMRRSEIAAKFDEIVGFAEVERFVDTPVKRYSSGMYVRLAFAVAAHLESDILLVDEVLSVGDYGFQQRCLGKMQEQTDAEGRTVLFVSHNLGAVNTLTERCIWLDKGRLRAQGATPDVFREYILSFRDAAAGGAVDLSDGSTGRPAKPFAQDVMFHSLELQDDDGQPSETHVERDPIRVVVRLRAPRRLNDVRVELMCRISTLQGVLVFTAINAFEHLDLDDDVYETSFTIDPNPLAPGTYSIELYAVSMSDRVGDRAQDRVERAMTFNVQEASAPSNDVHLIRGTNTGVIKVDYAWSDVKPVSTELRGAVR